MAKKGGKYSSVIGALPTLGIDPSRRDAVTQAQEQIKATAAYPDDDGRKAVDMLKHLREGFEMLVVMKKRQTAGKPWASEYARAYAECRAIRDKIAEWDGAFSLLVEAYQWLMIEQLEVEGTTALKLANGQSISTFKEPNAKVDDPEAFRQWCATLEDVCMTCGTHRDDHHPSAGDDALLYGEDEHIFKPGGGLANKMALAWGTTNALTKERLLAGEPEPPGVSVWAKTVVRLGAGDE